MKYLLKAEEGEAGTMSIPWELTFYDDVTEEITVITEFQSIDVSEDEK